MNAGGLDDQLVEAAAEAAYEATASLLAPRGTLLDSWSRLPAQYRELNIAASRAAIAHFLANRTLPDRMRDSVGTLNEATVRVWGTNHTDRQLDWNPSMLAGWADQIEREQAAQAQQYDLVEKLAQVIYWESGTSVVWADASAAIRDVYLNRSRAIVASDEFTITLRES